MLKTNARREVEALEKISRASVRMANAAGRMAEIEKEKTGFLKWFVGLFGGARSRPVGPSSRRYGGNGGLRSGSELPPKLPIAPIGGNALPTGERSCINVTHSVRERVEN